MRALVSPFLVKGGIQLTHIPIITDLHAFCATCPAPEEVTSVLQELGFRLSFQMDAIVYPTYTQLSDLPAQYHYQNDQGTEVIYLHGRDTDPDGLPFPAHASRFWVYCGRDERASRRIVQGLAQRWVCSWRRLSQRCQDVA